MKMILFKLKRKVIMMWMILKMRIDTILHKKKQDYIDPDDYPF